MSRFQRFKSKGRDLLGKRLAKGGGAAVAGLWAVDQMAAVWLPDDPEAIHAELAVDLNIDEADAFFLTATASRVCVQNSHGLSLAHGGAFPPAKADRWLSA